MTRLRALATAEEFETAHKSLKDLLKSQVKEPSRRVKGKILSLHEYMKERIDNSGMFIWMNICLITEQIKITKELSADESFQAVLDAYIGAIWVSNVRLNNFLTFFTF